MNTDEECVMIMNDLADIDKKLQQQTTTHRFDFRKLASHTSSTHNQVASPQQSAKDVLEQRFLQTRGSLTRNENAFTEICRRNGVTPERLSLPVAENS